jgi:hypothetical protein
LKGLRNEFVKSLLHRSWIVQVSELKGRSRNDPEILLSIFDQANRTYDSHILNLNMEHFPDAYRPIVHRLRLADTNKEVRESMYDKDDITEYFHIKERILWTKLEKKDAAIAEPATLKAIEELKNN